MAACADIGRPWLAFAPDVDEVGPILGQPTQRSVRRLAVARAGGTQSRHPPHRGDGAVIAAFVVTAAVIRARRFGKLHDVTAQNDAPQQWRHWRRRTVDQYAIARRGKTSARTRRSALFAGL